MLKIKQTTRFYVSINSKGFFIILLKGKRSVYIAEETVKLLRFAASTGSVQVTSSSADHYSKISSQISQLEVRLSL